MHLFRENKWLQQRLIGTSFVIGLVIPVFIGVTAYQSIAQLMKSADWRAHTHQVISTVHNLLIDLLNAETGMRDDVVFMGDTMSGAQARRLLPLTILIPFLLGWLRLIGQQRGLYGTEFGFIPIQQLSTRKEN